MALLTKFAGGGASLRQRIVWLVGLALLGLAIPAASAQTADQLKATYLFKLTQYVEWPASTFHDADAPMVIGVLGEDPFGAFLDETVKGEKIDGHPLIVRRYKRVEEVTECHILFISSADTAELEKIFARLKDRPILTVGDAPTFTRQGGMVRFVVEEGKKTQFRVCVETAKACNLKISSLFLALSKIVAPGND